MKDNTKKLLDKILKTMKTGEATVYIEEEIKQFEEFCSKVETIEHDLQNGGFILDINKKPCKAGGKVCETDGEMREGVLSWDNYSRCFCFDCEGISDKLDEMDFEKC